MSVSVESYLALHWALVAAKGRMYGQAARLGVKWLKRPNSIFHLLEMRFSKRAMKVATRLEAVKAASELTAGRHNTHPET